MSFYQAMQLGAVNLKPLIKKTEDKKLKQKYITAFVLKNILCLLFCMVVVISFSKMFNEENSIVGVVTVMCILTFRFSNFDFNVKQTVLAILGIFGIYMIFPTLAMISSPGMQFVINFIAILAILILSCHNVIFSNQSILVLSYLLLYGYKVTSTYSYSSRVVGLAVGGIIVATIFYIKQRKNKFENNFIDILKDFNIKNERSRWQLKLTLAICSALFIGNILNLPRIMWIGFACMSIVQPKKEQVDIRCKERIPYVTIGSLIYCALYLVLPQQYLMLIGMMGGIMVGFSATYKWQTVFNVFGALSSAVPILGLPVAVIFRIVDNVFGALYGKFFSRLFDKVESRFIKNIEEVPVIE